MTMTYSLDELEAQHRAAITAERAGRLTMDEMFARSERQPSVYAMTDLDAIMLIEGGDFEEEEHTAAWQQLIDSGTAWNLQGFYQRGACRMIELGLCTRTRRD